MHDMSDSWHWGFGLGHWVYGVLIWGTFFVALFFVVKFLIDGKKNR